LPEAREVRRKPVSKKMIIITLGVGLLSFGGAFAFAFFMREPQTSPSDEPEKALDTVVEEVQTKTQQLPIKTNKTIDTGNINTTKSLTEQQLKNLIHDLRKKMQDYENRLHVLKVEEERLQTAKSVLQEDIEKLNSLQIELASITVNLKNERDKLIKSRIEIDQSEQTNLISIAASYDTMNASSASKIVTNMCMSEDSEEGQEKKIDDTRGSYNDAVKILYYMSDRTKAKLLAELATSEPQLAASLSQRLKHIVEVN
jgi:chromosome segregation ATPase